MLILMSLVLCSFLLVWCLGFVKAFPRTCAQTLECSVDMHKSTSDCLVEDVINT